MCEYCVIEVFSLLNPQRSAMRYGREIRHGFANKSKRGGHLVRGHLDFAFYEGVQAVNELTGADFLAHFLRMKEAFTNGHWQAIG